MPEFKIVINEQGKGYAKNLTSEESEVFLSKKIKDKIDGNNFGLKGYEFEITGGSDKEGFPMRKDVEGIGRKKIFITRGMIGSRLNKKGLRLRRSISGNTISQLTSQINLKVIKTGQKSLTEILGKKIDEEKKEVKKERLEEKKENK